MLKDDLLVLYDYNYWANARILNAAARITPEQFISPANLSHGSLRGTLVHILGADIVWRMRCQEGISLPAMPSESEYPTVEALRTGWAAEEQQMRAYLATLTDQSLQETVRYRTTQGVPYENSLRELLVHIVNHGTQFRAEAGIALTAYGQSPGDMDLIFFMREQAK